MTTSPAETLRAAAQRLRDNPDALTLTIYTNDSPFWGYADRPGTVFAAWLDDTARSIDDDTQEIIPDCCGEIHTEPGLIHGACTWWLTTYRRHSEACKCFDAALATAHLILNTPKDQR